jgi:hypothetical protein
MFNDLSSTVSAIITSEQRVQLSTRVFCMYLSFGLSVADGNESDNRPRASLPFHLKGKHI